jgi:hypothetical protein
MAAAVLYVTDLGRMRRFYECCFGLSLADGPRDGFAILTSEAWELSLVTLTPEIAATVTITDPPARRAGSPVKLARHLDCLDPEGNVVQLRERTPLAAVDVSPA